MKKIRFRLLVAFIAISPCLSLGQSSLCDDCPGYDVTNYTDRQCIFDRYEAPLTPSLFRQWPLNERMGSDFHLAVLVHFDTSGFVTSLKFSRLAGFGNNLSPQDTLWTLAEASVREASKNWKAKPLLWHNLDVPPGGFDDNAQAWSRPNGGVQSHFIIFEFKQNKVSDAGNRFDRIYMLGTRG